MNTETAAEAQIEVIPQEISFGDLIWKKHKTDERFYTFIPSIGEAHITQYTDKECGSFGKWHWCVYLYTGCLLDKNISTNLSHRFGIEDDIGSAMMNCLNARSDLIGECLAVIKTLCHEDPYSMGFSDGQEDIKAKVAEVVL